MKCTEADLALQREALRQQQATDKENGYTPQDPEALRGSTAPAGTSSTPWASVTPGILRRR
jgi:hypothetical protein